MCEQNTTKTAENQPASLTAGKTIKFLHPLLDRVTLLGDFKHTDQNMETLSKHPDFEQSAWAKHPYLQTIVTSSGIDIRVADPKAKVAQVRIDFNPSKINTDGTLFECILPMLKNKRFSRLDYALDTTEDLSEWSFSTPNAKQTVEYRSRSGRLETLYLGARESAAQYRIYDKQLESKLPSPLWRIEQQLRFSPDDDFYIRLPFTDLTMFQFAADLDGEEAILLEAITRNPSLLSKLTDWNRRKFRRLLKATDKLSHVSPHPFHAFMAGFQPISDLLAYWLQPEYKTFSEYTEKGEYRYAT